jgi:cobalt-zinc-cadmium efflux system protein
MGHGHRHDHTAGARTTADGERRVFWALLITASFMVAEVAGGIVSGSLALLYVRVSNATARRR